MNLPYKTFACVTLGCKLNFSESSFISNNLIAEGIKMVDAKSLADIYIIHTCTVTQTADAKCRAAIRQCIRKNPNAKIIVIGCYAQLQPEVFAEMNGVDLVLGNEEKYQIVEYLKKIPHSKDNTQVFNSNIKESKTFIPTFSFNDRTRCFFKIQDGCDYYCSYCTIPHARGRSRSGTIADTFELAKTFSANRVINEMVITGVNIGDFGKLHDENLLGLLMALEKIENIKRIRLSSIEPDLITEDLINFIAQSAKIMPHLHIPLQAGNDEILKLMKRRYTTVFFEALLSRIKKKIPNCFLATDVIVGFPSENNAQFNQSIAYLSKLPLGFIHVFSYSDRKGTYAQKLAEKVDSAVKQERSVTLQLLSERMKENFYSNYVGKTAKVLFESTVSDGYIGGFTENYLRVKHHYRKDLVNTIQAVRLERLDENIVFEVSLI